MRLKIGVQWTAELGHSRAAVEAAVLAEELGYYSFGLPDHLVTRGGPSATLLDPVPTLSAVAVRTERIRLTTTVLIAMLRRPVQLVRSVATLQDLSDGRAEVGIGAGWVPYETALFRTWTGRPLVDTVCDTVKTLRCAFAPDGSCENSTHHLAAEMVAATKPPTFMVAAGGPAMLRLAAEHADVVMLTVPTNSRLKGAVATRDLVASQIAYVRRSNLDRTPDFHLQVRSYEPDGAPVVAFEDNLWTLYGSQQSVAAQLDELESLGLSYLAYCTDSLANMERFAADLFPLLRNE